MQSSSRKLLLLLVLLLISSCKTWRPSLFVQRTPRERYTESLRDAPAGKSPTGLRWAADADSALRHASSITLPYRETGRIPAGVNAAAALQFSVTQGERVLATLQGAALPAFLELYRLESGVPERLVSPDSGNGLSFDAVRTGTYVLLLQHNLETTADYTLTLALIPSLAYPATNPKKNRIGSVWGDPRDAGARRHEGVDIFAPKGSPALAAAPGRIVRLTDGGIGGKTVWLRPEGKPYSLYYAHLDSQWVHEGQFVQTGDTLGQIGNTGNARHTAAHLHFGIYGNGGAVDPAPFIRPKDTTTVNPKYRWNASDELMTTREAAKLLTAPDRAAALGSRLPANTQVRVLAATREFVRVRIADTLAGWLPNSIIKKG